MLEPDDLQYAQAVYLGTRHIWFADSLLDAHERLALVTVAAQVRQFAFLSHLKPKARRDTASLLSAIGLQSRLLNVSFDLIIKLQRVSEQSTNAYRAYRRRQRFFGVGVWRTSKKGVPVKDLTLAQLGSALGYPACCVRMDVHTKEEDHQLFLKALINEYGDDPAQIAWALKRRSPVQKSSYAYLRRWEHRYRSTLARFPFVLHTACDQCLNHSDSPSATLNDIYERLAKEVSEELHFLVRWAAHAGCGGRDQ